MNEVTRLCFANVSDYVGNVLLISFIFGFSLVQIKGPLRFKTRPTQSAVFACHNRSKLRKSIFIDFFSLELLFNAMKSSRKAVVTRGRKLVFPKETEKFRLRSATLTQPMHNSRFGRSSLRAELARFHLLHAQIRYTMLLYFLRRI